MDIPLFATSDNFNYITCIHTIHQLLIFIVSTAHWKQGVYIVYNEYHNKKEIMMYLIVRYSNNYFNFVATAP